MTLGNITDGIVETDVLIIGGGIGGCCAAVKAREHGLSVTIAEKANPERSGSAARGIDHYGTFPRDGVTPLQLARYFENRMSDYNGEGLFVNSNIMYKIFNNQLWTLQELEKLGIPMKWDNGQYYWIPDFRYGANKVMLRVHWQNVKPLLSTALKNHDVNVLKNMSVVDLLTNRGTVVGATAINTRTGEFVIIKAKATIMATGMFARCYEPEVPTSGKYRFIYFWCPTTVSGDGYAMAYRAGADLVNMDLPEILFRVRDLLAISCGFFGLGDGLISNRYTWKGKEFTTLSIKKYFELEQKGETPLYVSLEHLPDDYHKRLEVAFADERLFAFKLAEDRGFNPRTHRYETLHNEPYYAFMRAPGINIDEDFNTSRKGLYAIGDCAPGFHGCGPASISGLLTGDSIHKYVDQAENPVIDEAQVEAQKQVALAPLKTEGDTEPLELEYAVRYICQQYIGLRKSEGKLREGQRRLDTLRRVALSNLRAKNPHYLARCLEVRNVLDLAEVHLQACLERKETRGNFIRLDYPQKDPSRDSKLTYQRMEKGKAVLEIREVPELKPEYAREGK